MSAYPAISLWQPWASLLFVRSGKVHETRHWPAPQGLIGQTILIHASKKRMALDNYGPDLQRLCEQHFGPLWRDEIPYGALIGAARLDTAFQIGRRGPSTEVDELAGNWTPGRFAWRFVNRRPLLAPHPAVGRQGFWFPEWPADPGDLATLLGTPIDGQ
jgi:hypothetical protein